MKKTIGNILWFCLLFLISQIPMSVAFSWRIVNETRKIGFDLVELVITILVFLVSIFIFIRVAKKLEICDWSFQLKGKLHYVWIGVALVFGVSILGSFIMQLQGVGNTANQEALDSISKDIPPMLMWLLAAVGAGVMEETLFRGFFLKVFFPKRQLIGLFSGAFLFGLMHTPTNIGSAVTYIGMGLVLGFVAYRTQRLEASILTHFIWNSLAVIAMYGLNV